MVKEMDLTKQFVVMNKNEIFKFKTQIDQLIHEKQRLAVEKKEIKEKFIELELENRNLKNQLSQKVGLESRNNSIHSVIRTNGLDQNATAEFIQSQEEPDFNSKANRTPTQTQMNQSVQNYQFNGCPNQVLNFNPDISESTNESLNIGHGINRNRRESNFNRKTESESDKQNDMVNVNQKQRKIIDMVYQNNTIKSKGWAELESALKNKGSNHSIMIQIIAKEWNHKPENMSRMDFFYHLLSSFIKNGILVTICNEHSPPCRPRVDSKLFEKNAIVLKKFVSHLNQMRFIFFGVELLVALEHVIYAQPKYRPALSEIMDLLFKNGVVEAVAFGEWAQMDSHRPIDKAQLIREIKASGFCLIKRASI